MDAITAMLGRVAPVEVLSLVQDQILKIANGKSSGLLTLGMLGTIWSTSSGMTALIYQVLWLRLLGLVFGVTVYAASTVWASFMAGLAIGSLAAGKIADRVRNPLRWFGAAE